MRVELALAWLLPLLTGAAVCGLAAPTRHWPGRVAALAGSGWLAGVLLAAIAASMLARTDTLHAVQTAAPWMAALAAVGTLLAVARGWGARRRHRDGRGEVVATPRWQHACWWLLLLLVALRLAMLAAEAALRPVFPWDAWSAWALKPKSWILLGEAQPYVSMFDWLADPFAATRTTATWHYPELLAWIEVWFASGAGGWNESLVNLAWSGALAAFGLAAYGYWRGFGVRALPALGLVAALASLPLLDAHVALAGYADLWIAVTLGCALLAWARWLIWRERAQWLLALAFAACLPAIKLEGAIWLALFVAVVAYDIIPARRRAWAIAGACVVLGGIVALGVSDLAMPGSGWMKFDWPHVGIAAVPVVELGWHPVGGAMLASLFTLPNWHLLWYALPLLVALRWRFLVQDRAARALGLLLLLQGLALFVLFFFTNAGEWATDFTSANRLILQLVPGVFVFAATLLRDAGDARADQPRQAR